MLIKLMVSKCSAIIKSKITIAFSLLVVIAMVMMSSMVSNVDAAPFTHISISIFWFCGFSPSATCFNYPEGIAVDSSGNVFVADTENNRIEKTGSTGGFIRTWGSIGTGNEQFNKPYGVAVDKSDNVFVADTENNRIQEFTNTGKFIRAWGSSGTANGQYNRPSGIAVDSSGNVFVADAGNNRIQKFQLASPCPKGTEITSGVCFITKWGSHGSANGQFDLPLGVAVDSSGNVVVVDFWNSRIQKFKTDGTIKTWGSLGSGNGQFIYPRGIAVDSSGNVFVTDGGNSRIQEFKNDGTYFRQWGKEGSGDGQFNAPRGIAVHPTNDIIFVVDKYNNRIQKFNNDGGFMRTWGSFGPYLKYCDGSLRALGVC
jgi:DNA-binding beta-propeller fold protein YncE